MMTMKTDSLIYATQIHDGVQRVYRFPNGWGASVVRHDYSYGGKQGLWELAVITWDGKGDGPANWEISYATPITGDVLGHLTIGAVNDLLDEIRALPRELEPEPDPTPRFEKTGEVWFVKGMDECFQSKMDAEIAAREMFPEQNIYERYARIYFRVLLGLAS
jgi:hypothetical protein